MGLIISLGLYLVSTSRGADLQFVPSHFLNPNIDILTPSSLPPTLSSSDKEDDEGHPGTGSIFFFFEICFIWINLKVFIESITILLLLYVLGFWLQGMWDFSFPTRD